jgi:hypothetical protein
MEARIRIGDGDEKAIVKGGPDASTAWKLYWLHCDPGQHKCAVAIDTGAWEEKTLSGAMQETYEIKFGSGFTGNGAGAMVDEVVLWKDFRPSDTQRADMYANHRGPGHFGLDAWTPPQSPLASIELVNERFVTDSGLIAAGEEPGTYWLQPYPLHAWDASLAAAKGKYVWFRSTDHGPGGIFRGYSNSPSQAPASWSKVIDNAALKESTDEDWGSLETPHITYHADDPAGKPFYCTAHGMNVTKTKRVTNTISSTCVFQESVRFRSADLETWEFDGVVLPAVEYMTEDVDDFCNHTGYMVTIDWGDGTWRATSTLCDTWGADWGFKSGLLDTLGTRGPRYYGSRFSKSAWWFSSDGRSWDMQRWESIQSDWTQTGGGKCMGRANMVWKGKRYAISGGSGGTLNYCRIYERNDDGTLVWPGWPIYTHNRDADPLNEWIQGKCVFMEAGVLHLYTKHGHKEPNGKIRYYRGTLR